VESKTFLTAGFRTADEICGPEQTIKGANPVNQEKRVSTFKEKAGMVSAIVHDVPDIGAALEKTVDLCRKKKALENLMPGQGGDAVPGTGKILAAPNLDPASYQILELLCRENDIFLIKENVRKFPGGMDMGLTLMDFGIAETGTLVLNSDSEETRLATMLCETHVAVINRADIRETALAMADELTEMTRHPSSYTAFITGASRTADIERVLALGVHGPLELHIILTGEN
jgi:L-lactate dehydrogenase complex protein LldG